MKGDIGILHGRAFFTEKSETFLKNPLTEFVNFRYPSAMSIRSSVIQNVIPMRTHFATTKPRLRSS